METWKDKNGEDVYANVTVRMSIFTGWIIMAFFTNWYYLSWIDFVFGAVMFPVCVLFVSSVLSYLSEKLGSAYCNEKGFSRYFMMAIIYGGGFALIFAAAIKRFI